MLQSAGEIKMPVLWDSRTHEKLITHYRSPSCYASYVGFRGYLAANSRAADGGWIAPFEVVEMSGIVKV